MSNRFAYKNDYPELVDTANFIRSLFPQVKVKIEHYVIFNAEGKFDRLVKGIYQGCTEKFRNPDLMLFVNKKFLCCIEIDGSVHDVMVDKTDRRNDDYKTAGIDLVVINKEELKLENLNIFEKLEQEISKRLNSSQSNSNK